MLKLKKERIKTYLLLLLICTSLIQIGIHWYQQSQGFPFNFLAPIFNGTSNRHSKDIGDLKSEYFTPEEIIVFLSPTQFKLEQDDSYFKNIWSDMKENYLPSVIKTRPSKTIPKDQWEDIINERCVRINFSINWPSDAIFWLEDTYPNDFRYFSSIKSIAVLPEKNVNQTVNTVFIYDENQVYQYDVNIKEDFLPKEYYIELADKLSRQGEPKLDVLTDRYKIFKSDEDILISLSNAFSSAFPTIKIEIPSAIQLDLQNIGQVQNSILLNQKDSFAPRYNESTGEAVFTDTENLYKYFENGILEYKYLPVKNEPAGKVSSVLNHVLSFIELRKDLIGDASLVMTYLEKPNNSYYEMHFNYIYNGVPVYFKDLDSNGRISPPLVIKANEERVLECKWVIRSISNRQEAEKYNLYFVNLIENEIPDLYPEIIERDELYFKRIEPGYVFELNDEDELPVTPKWVISTESNDYYIPLKPKGD